MLNPERNYGRKASLASFADLRCHFRLSIENSDLMRSFGLMLTLRGFAIVAFNAFLLLEIAEASYSHIEPHAFSSVSRPNSQSATTTKVRTEKNQKFASLRTEGFTQVNQYEKTSANVAVYTKASGKREAGESNVTETYFPFKTLRFFDKLAAGFRAHVQNGNERKTYFRSQHRKKTADSRRFFFRNAVLWRNPTSDPNLSLEQLAANVAEAKNASDVFMLRLSSVRLKVLERKKNDTVHEQILKQVQKSFGLAAEREGWSDEKLTRSADEYLRGSGYAVEKNLAQKEIDAQERLISRDDAVLTCTQFDLKRKEIEHILAELEFWNTGEKEIHSWLRKRRVQKCAHSLAQITKNVAKNMKRSEIRKIEETACKFRLSDEKYSSKLVNFIFRFDLSVRFGHHKRAIDKKAKDLYDKKIRADQVKLKKKMRADDSLEKKLLWRSASKKVQEKLVAGIRSAATKGNWDEKTVTFILKEKLKSFKENYSDRVKASLTVLQKQLEKKRRSVLNKYRHALQTELRERKVGLLAKSYTSPRYRPRRFDFFGRKSRSRRHRWLWREKKRHAKADAKAKQISYGLDHRFRREMQKARKLLSSAKNPHVLSNALKKEKIVRERLAWLKAEVDGRVREEKESSDQRLRSKIKSLEAGPSPLEKLFLTQKREEAAQLSREELQKTKRGIVQAEMSYEHLPICYDPNASIKARSTALKNEIDKVTQSNFQIRKAVLESPYRWGQRRLNSSLRAAESLLNQVQRDPSSFVYSSVPETEFQIKEINLPAIDPAFLGIEKKLLFGITNQRDIEDALFDLGFVHDRQSKLKKETLERLFWLSSEKPDEKLAASVQDTKDWQIFHRALRILASKNMCGAVYNQKTSSFGVCCMFKVEKAGSTAFSYVKTVQSRMLS